MIYHKELGESAPRYTVNSLRSAISDAMFRPDEGSWDMQVRGELRPGWRGWPWRSNASDGSNRRGLRGTGSYRFVMPACSMWHGARMARRCTPCAERRGRPDC